MKAMVTTGVDIDNIRIKITPLFSCFVVTNHVFVPDLILGGRFVMKFINFSCQIRWGIESGFKRLFFCSRLAWEWAYVS